MASRTHPARFRVDVCLRGLKNYRVVVAANTQLRTALQHASEDLKNDRDDVVDAVTQHSDVIVEVAYDGGVARSGGFQNSLPAKGWQPESNAPSWGDKKSRMKVFSYMVPEGVQLQLPATSGHALFSIVVVGISASSDKQVAEELKRVFRLWDTSSKGGIQRGDLEAFLTALCPGLDGKNKEALMDSLDRSKSGFLSYEEFVDKVVVSR